MRSLVAGLGTVAIASLTPACRCSRNGAMGGDDLSFGTPTHDIGFDLDAWGTYCITGCCVAATP